MTRVYLSAEQAAERLRCSVRSLMRYKAAGLIRFIQHGPRGRIWFAPESLDRFDSEQKTRLIPTVTEPVKPKKKNGRKPNSTVHQKSKAELAVKLGRAKSGNGIKAK